MKLLLSLVLNCLLLLYVHYDYILLGDGQLKERIYILCEPGKVLDSPRARLFTNTPSVISAFVPRNLSLSERLDWLHGHFQCKDIIVSSTDIF